MVIASNLQNCYSIKELCLSIYFHPSLFPFSSLKGKKMCQLANLWLHHTETAADFTGACQQKASTLQSSCITVKYSLDIVKCPYHTKWCDK